MRRREFIASLFSGAALSAPFSGRGGSPELDEARVPLAVLGEQLLSDLQDANRKLAEADPELIAGLLASSSDELSTYMYSCDC